MRSEEASTNGTGGLALGHLCGLLGEDHPRHSNNDGDEVKQGEEKRARLHEGWF
jgi:hypothetical protein